MTNQLTTMLATPYYIDATSITITTDITSSEVKTLPAGYYVPYLKLSQSFTFGTINDPYEVFQKFVSASSPTYFSFSLTSQGKTQIEYLGTGSGNITFSYVAQKMLGFKSNSLSFASQAVKYVSDYSPYGSVFSFAKTNNSGWTKTPQGSAYSMTPDGYVWGYKNSYDIYTQKFNLRFHPKDQTTQLSDSSINSTPLYYVSKSMYLNQFEGVEYYMYGWNKLPTLLDFSTDTGNTLGPFIYTSYTVQEFLQQCPGQPIHALLGNFQQCISGSNKEYLVVFQTPESIKKENQFKPSLLNFDKLYDIEDLEISLYRKFTTNTLSSSYVTGSTAFSPSDISNLYAWYRGDLVTYDGSNKVSVWPDKSGNGKHLSQSNSVKQPVYSASIASRNNQPGIHATGGAYLQAENFALRTYKTIFMVVGSTGSMSYVSSLYNGGVERFYAYHPGSATFYNRDNSTGQHYITNTGGNFIQANVNHTFLYDGVTPQLFRSSSNVAGSVAGSATADNYATGSFSLFSGWAGGSPSTMQILEVLVYNKALNSTERTQVWNYLATRYDS